MARVVPRKPRPTLDSLKADVWAELKRGDDIIEAELQAKGGQFYGLCVNSKKVYINPTPSIIDTVLHELIHRTHPKMSERAVANKAYAIMRRMGAAEMRQWVRQYKAVARKRRTPLNVDAA
jgi:hypothetical protein